MKNEDDRTFRLKKEIDSIAGGLERRCDARAYFRGKGYEQHLTDPVPLARAWAFASMLEGFEPHIYENDLIVGSMVSMLPEKESLADSEYYEQLDRMYGQRGWLQGCDHFAPAYARLLALGIDGILKEIETSARHHADEEKKRIFLDACRVSMTAFQKMILGHGAAAREERPEGCGMAARESGTECCEAAWKNAASQRSAISAVCEKIAHRPPENFREALQLVWFCHLTFQFQGLNAMALGRMDQYLYPFYEKDLAQGIMTRDEAQELLENVFMKMHEHRAFFDGEDICNICIGGITPDGEDAVNDLTYVILHAVGHCNIPGPNLSARVHPDNPKEFLKECLKVIGTGLGYPALMNDEVNLAALAAKGYDQADVNDYCMVGCIENFLPGLQPPWSDGRYNTVKMLELALNQGCDLRTGKRMGPATKDPLTFASMEDVMEAYRIQLKAGAERYAGQIIAENSRLNNENFVNPFLSCLAWDCVEKGLDICDGGARYKAAHGACTMGIGTIADSLAAIESCVFQNGDDSAENESMRECSRENRSTEKISMETLLKALRANFEGYEKERAILLKAPKYGNDDDRADKYAVWFVDYTADLFDQYRLADGGRFYTAMASNTANIPAGKECAATPDGRLADEPLSDAASPTYGRDQNGPTCTALSLSKPDYSRVACGTVVNQKFTPQMFEGEENLERLCGLIRVYFARGGQEMQINAVSRQDLVDALERPENYGNLVIRVSGFSAYYVKLEREIQLDILSRTEHVSA